MSETATMTTTQTPTETQIQTLPLDVLPEQLTLLPAPAIPPQFRLDEHTRQSGLQHVAQLRAQIAAQAANRHGSVTRMRPPRPQIAA